MEVAVSGVTTQATLAQLFQDLHRQQEVLILPNVWDVGSTILLSQVAGVQALGTTSAGIAAALGVGDGEQLSLDRMVALVAQITRATTLPVSVDLETGYGRTAADVADSVTAIIEAGAVGVNLEDGDPADAAALLAAEELAERISAAVEAARRLHVPIVVNGRTDIYWRQSGPPEDRFAETVRRLRLYARAGAQCVFAPGFPGPAAESQRAAIRELVHELGDTPLNLLADPSLPPVAELRDLGVRRLSTGSALYRLGLAAVRDAASGLVESGSLDSLKGAQGLSYPDLAAAVARSATTAATTATAAVDQFPV